jgi:hypothetical protein
MMQKSIAALAVFSIMLSFALVLLAWPGLIAADPVQILVTLAIGGAAGLTMVLLDMRLARKHGNFERDV